MLVALDARQNSRVVPLPQAERGARLIALQAVLAEKFPSIPVCHTGIMPTGIEAIDRVEGGLRLGAMTEISGTQAGSSLLLAALLGTLAKEKRLGALVDCGKFFDPGSFQPSCLKRLLWVRCGLPAEAVKAADLLLRDGNLSLLVIDLQGAELRGALRIPANTWHRFQRVVEQGNMALAIFSSRPLVEGASVKIALDWRWNFPALAERRTELLTRLSARASSRRHLVMPSGLERHTA
ncbi:MAG: hypothetical protein ABSE62_13305 [Chthoniobacteraceae bacterium]|jgi:hypothetical protein